MRDDYPYIDGASYFNRYDYLTRVVACPGIKMKSLEKSLYNPNFKQELRKKYLLPLLNDNDNNNDNFLEETFSMRDIDEVLRSFVDEPTLGEVKKKLRERKK